MFIYESGNSLNLTFKGCVPVENPDVVIKGYKDGATLTVNGTTYGSGTDEFEGKAQTFVYQKDGKLVITFRGIAGMSDPEVTIDEDKDNACYVIVIGNQSVTLSIVDESVVVTEQTDNSVEEETSKTEPEEPKSEPEGPTFDLPEYTEEEE